jgi:hypothetical protein
MSSEGADLLSRLADFLACYVAFPSPEARDAVALWIVHAYAIVCFESTPRLALLSAEKQSGKTRTLEVIELLLFNAKHASNLTPAALFRLVGSEESCTLLFDEVDVFFGNRAKEHEELRGLLNAGHRRGAMAYRCVGEPSKMRVEEFPAFCPVALAGIGDLPDTILDRAILIAMRRRAPGEAVQSFRRREVQPQAEEIRDWIRDWCDHHQIELEAARPMMPVGITDRPADTWEPLLAIADVAGEEWPERARRAAVRLNEERQAADPSLGVRLLADTRTVFAVKEVDRLASGVLVEALVALEESPWGDIRGKALEARSLARRLAPYKIRPKVVRIGESTPHGYDLGDFIDAWERYLPTPRETATSATPQHSNGHLPAELELAMAEESA